MQAQRDRDRTGGPGLFSSPPAAGHRHRPGLIVAALAFAISLAGYGAEILAHRPGLMLTWHDLGVHLDSGLHARRHPSILYSWQLTSSVRFVYTPFAAFII